MYEQLKKVVCLANVELERDKLVIRNWGQFGIKVNCVAPGNVFEGSKIWNPEYIKACAKKYGIKHEEVIPYYINKTALKREIKGQDIANAVVFYVPKSPEPSPAKRSSPTAVRQWSDRYEIIKPKISKENCNGSENRTRMFAKYKKSNAESAGDRRFCDW
jgi:hypothetical protein